VAYGSQALQDALGERYELIGELARGGMATVYRARDLRYGRLVAVKVFDPSLASSVGALRFQNEIAIASALSHPSIVPVFDSGGGDELLYYVMPLIEGESLRARLEREKQLPVEDAIRIAQEVAGALALAHAAGVVHRDIKPENIMLGAGHALVTDFGIARAITTAAGDRLTSRAMVIGTPAYMAPEQADSTQEIDGRADIYALGCVLFEMLAGDPPFSGRTAQAIIARHQAERPPSLEVVRSTVPPGLQSTVERALAKVPADRFHNAQDFSTALGIVGSGAWTDSGRATRSRRTTRLMGVAAGVVTAAAIVALALFNRAIPINPDKVVVFPFMAPGAPTNAGTGEQVALLIGSALEHTEPFVWLDGSELIGRPPGNERLSPAVAARAARRAGARYYVDGAVLESRDSLTVVVRLRDAVADSLVRQESVAGVAAMVTAPQLALKAIGLILPRILPPTGRVDLSYLADRNASAIADWLQGERAYAHSQYAAALEHMNRALEKDSALGVAALKGAQAAAALEDYAAASRLIDVALKLDHQLPRRHLALAHGLAMFLAGSADSAVTLFLAAQHADTTWSEPWTWLGETYYHLFPAAVGLDSLAEYAFGEALRLSPSYSPAIMHLTESAARRGLNSRARKLLDAFRAVSPDSDLTFQLEITVRCAADGPGDIDWAGAVRRSSERVVNVARVLAGGAQHIDCSRRALESVLAFDHDTASKHSIYRWSALKGLNFIAMLRPDEARVATLLDSALASGVRAAPSLYVLDAAAGSRAAEAHADTAMRGLATMPIDKMMSARLRYLSLWTWHTGDVVALDSVARRSRTIADSSGIGTDQLIADGAVARLALLRGDTAAAIAGLRRVRPASGVGLVTWDFWESASAERILLAQLLLATGDAKGARDVAELFDSPRSQVQLLYLPASLKVRLAAAEKRGNGGERSRLEDRIRAIGR
jgi:tetratricopeptide (TPR) repeat protein